MACPIILKPMRYVFGKEISAELKQFTEEHKEYDRKSYKLAWQKWTTNDNIKSLICAEIEKQPNADVMDKMYKSTWYYYRKKSDKNDEKQPRKKYDAFSGDIIREIEKHIRDQIQNNIDVKTSISNITPAESFNNFCRDCREIVLEEINGTYGDSQITNDEVKITLEKFKKAYKNKFYTVRVELMKNL
jgi:hypothetical protein